MKPARVNFIEWMKAFGMFLIIYGHTSGHALFNPTVPVNLKQIGVVLFVLSTGYLLANEKRPWPRVFYNRLFELYLFGIAFSVLMSFVKYFQIGDINESNYLPFALGLNVVFNGFPANQSLWYIGTYVHMLIFWALFLRHIRVRPWMIVLVVPFEMTVRAWLMNSAGDYIAYQALSNWFSILLLGVYLGQHSLGDRPEASRSSIIGYLSALALAVAGWLWGVHSFGVTEDNPFGRIPIGTETTQLVVTAASVSVVYLGWAFFAFQVFRRLEAGPVVQFFARNSMLCFIVHMPLVMALCPLLYRLPGIDTPGLLRLGVNILIFYVGLCLLSELIRRMAQPAWLRAAIEEKFIESSLARRFVGRPP